MILSEGTRHASRSGVKIPARTSFLTFSCAWIVIALAHGCPAPAAASHGAGTRAFEFLRLPAEPIGRSLAGAHLGAVEGPAALGWNPAGLGRDTPPAVVLSHATWVAETAWEWGALTLPIGEQRGALGVSLGIFRAGVLEAYDSEGTSLGSFSPLQAWVSAGYGVGLTRSLHVGLCAEGILERDGVGEERRAWAGGIGLQWDLGHVALGLSALHLAPEAQIEAQRFPVPRTLRAGATAHLTPALAVHAATEWVAAESPCVVAGWEWQPVAGLRALAGLQYDPQAFEQPIDPAYGLACTLGRIGVSYGYQPSVWLEASHQLALTFSLGPRL